MISQGFQLKQIFLRKKIFPASSQPTFIVGGGGGSVHLLLSMSFTFLLLPSFSAPYEFEQRKGSDDRDLLSLSVFLVSSLFLLFAAILSSPFLSSSHRTKYLKIDFLTEAAAALAHKDKHQSLEEEEEGVLIRTRSRCVYIAAAAPTVGFPIAPLHLAIHLTSLQSIFSNIELG